MAKETVNKITISISGQSSDVPGELRDDFAADVYRNILPKLGFPKGFLGSQSGDLFGRPMKSDFDHDEDGAHRSHTYKLKSPIKVDVAKIEKEAERLLKKSSYASDKEFTSGVSADIRDEELALYFDVSWAEAL